MFRKHAYLWVAFNSSGILLIADWRVKRIEEIENNLNACSRYFPW